MKPTTLVVLLFLAACAPGFKEEALRPAGLPCGLPARAFPAVELPTGAQIRVAACWEGTSRQLTGRLARATLDTLYLRQPRIFSGGRVLAVAWGAIVGVEVGSDNRELSFIGGVAVGLAAGLINGGGGTLIGGVALGTGLISAIVLPAWTWTPVIAAQPIRRP